MNNKTVQLWKLVAFFQSPTLALALWLRHLFLPQVLLQVVDDRQDNPTPNNSDYGGPNPAGADRHAHGGGHPDAGRRRQPLNAMLLLQLENRAGAQEANAGRYSLNDSAQI